VQSRRVVVLVLSFVLAALAALATYSYLQGTQDRANKGAALVQVYVVRHDVPKGTPAEKAFSDGYLGTTQIPAKLRPASSIVDPKQIAGKVALVALPANQVVVDGLFVDQRVAQVTNAQRVDPGQVAVSISLDTVRQVNGLLVPGDLVNVMAKRPYKLDRVTPDQAKLGYAAGQLQSGWGVLYQNVKVLFIGATAAPQAGETGKVVAPGSGVITFAVPQEAAERIVLASQGDGGLYLTLVPPGNQPQVVQPVGPEHLFGPSCDSLGADGIAGTADDTPAGCVPLTPYAPTATVAVAATKP
jgi:Flp pilus assembly protein CpaB